MSENHKEKSYAKTSVVQHCDDLPGVGLILGCC